jgi:hypothetical protein
MQEVTAWEACQWAWASAGTVMLVSHYVTEMALTGFAVLSSYLPVYSFMDMSLIDYRLRCFAGGNGGGEGGDSFAGSLSRLFDGLNGTPGHQASGSAAAQVTGAKDFRSLGLTGGLRAAPGAASAALLGAGGGGLAADLGNMLDVFSAGEPY